jgi:hypothetical protein
MNKFENLNLLNFLFYENREINIEIKKSLGVKNLTVQKLYSHL